MDAPNDAEYLAKLFHEYYEYLAPQFGYQTRAETSKPWEKVPDKNKRLMIAVAEKLLDGHVQVVTKESEPEDAAEKS